MDAITAVVRQDQTQDLFFTFSGAVPDLVVTGFAVEESVSGLFCIDIALASERSDIDLTALMDRPGRLTVHDRYGEPRHFHGVVESAERGDSGHRHTFYHLTLMPALHRLRFGSDSRIFQSKSVVEIVETVLKENGVTDFAWAVKEKHEPREYCVQYRETHLAFVERLLAEEGIWYHFTHEAKGRHVVHFLDVPEVAPTCPHQATLAYNAQAGGAVKGVYCQSFSVREQVRSTAYTQRDYTFKHPAYAQEHTQHAPETNGTVQRYALYAYPGRYKQDAAGKPFTRHRMEAVRVDATTGSGHANTPHLVCGHRFALTDHPREACNVKHLLLSVEHHGSQPQALEEDAGDGAATYGVRFTTMPARLPYRPPLLVKPVVDGPQMAHVVGPPGEEIFCDEFGRVKIQFPWDRYGKANDQSSCWIRVAQNWAGGAWGQIAIPRIGQEVVVDFLEGDPDQPIVTGRAYHAVNPPPYKLPDNKTRMTIKSKTHKGSGFNELRFEDEQGQEEVFMHAQKDHNAVVENDETWKIGGSRHKRVDGSQSESVGGDKDIELGGDHHEVIKGSHNALIKGSRVTQINISDLSRVKGDVASHVERNVSTLVDQHVRVETKGRQHYEAGTTVYVNAGDKVVIQAGAAISFNVGGNFITITGSGIVIEGSEVNINSGAGAPVKGAEAPRIEPIEPVPYKGPHAERYKRSFER